MCRSSDSRDEILLDKTGDLLGGNFYSQAYGVSVDGSVVVALSDTAFGIEGFRCTATVEWRVSEICL